MGINTVILMAEPATVDGQIRLHGTHVFKGYWSKLVLSEIRDIGTNLEVVISPDSDCTAGTEHRSNFVRPVE